MRSYPPLTNFLSNFLIHEYELEMMQYLFPNKTTDLLGFLYSNI